MRVVLWMSLVLVMVWSGVAQADLIEKRVDSAALNTSNQTDGDMAGTQRNFWSNIGDGFKDLFSGTTNVIDGAKLFIPQAEINSAEPAPASSGSQSDE